MCCGIGKRITFVARFTNNQTPMNATLHYSRDTDTLEAVVMIAGKDITIASCHPSEELMDDGYIVSYFGDTEIRVHHHDLGNDDLREWVMDEGRNWAAKHGIDIVT